MGKVIISHLFYDYCPWILTVKITFTKFLCADETVFEQKYVSFLFLEFRVYLICIHCLFNILRLLRLLRFLPLQNIRKNGRVFCWWLCVCFLAFFTVKAGWNMGLNSLLHHCCSSTCTRLLWDIDLEENKKKDLSLQLLLLLSSLFGFNLIIELQFRGEGFGRLLIGSVLWKMAQINLESD